ncbi:cadherin repeat domain-containing protein [Reichenbachiella versicolor]|uniref:cadherin repeat domain-containing protein n=1 Tax=Reichenbachiella versicolor TaxID=1821036 RepID=UPI000D6E4A4E|nr:cadherin repeat domain-containing protein [Reichenbachiella versicolor]
MKNLKLLILSIIVAAINLACTEDDLWFQNIAPEITNQSFSISEDSDEDVVIGTVIAIDPDNDKLSFSILQDTDSLFEITATGEIS